MDNKNFSAEDDRKLISQYEMRYSDLRALQDNYVPLYNEIAVLGDPRNAYFRVEKSPGNLSHLTAKTDDTLQANLPLHASVMNSLLTPAAYLWHSMVFSDPEIQAQFGQQLSVQNMFIYKKRYSSFSNFVCAINTVYMNNALYGWYVMELSKDIAHKQVTYRALPIKEFVIDQNERGFVDTFYRKVKFTYRQLRQLFPDYVPNCAKDQANSDYPYQYLNRTMELLHVVEPSIEHNRKFDSVYIDLTERRIIKKTVEPYCKYIAGRAATFSNTNDPYGFSPVMSVLPSTKNLNAVSFDIVKAAHHASRFDLLAGDDIVNPKNYPDVTSIINGGIDSEGRPQVSVLSQRDLPTLDYMIQGWQKRIKDALFVDMFASLQETQSRSATDAMLKANERANIIAPMGDRFSRELLQPMIELELQMYSEMKVLPEFPEQAAGAHFDIVLDNPMLRGQRLDSAQAIMNLGSSYAQIQPFDTEFNLERTSRYLASAYNVPLEVFNTPEEKQQLIDERQAAAEQQQMIENANKVGAGIKNLAEAGNIMDNSGGQQ